MTAIEEQTALESRHVTKLYVGTVALEDVSPIIWRGEVHGPIGKNGAGKSILVGIVSGLVVLSSGEIWINGQKYISLSSIMARRQCISIITQGPQVIEENTVMGNSLMPGYLDSEKVIDWSEMRRGTVETLDQAGLPIDVSVKMRSLSIGERQLLLVVRAYLVKDVEIVVMDEVLASLSQKDQVILYHIIDDLISTGKTVVFISHHTEKLLRVCDWIMAARDGHNAGGVMRGDLDKKKLASLTVGNINYDEQIVEDMPVMVQGEGAFVLKNLISYGKLRDTSMFIRKGEIVGPTGLRGSERAGLIKSMIGIDMYDGGTVWVAGSQKHYHSPVAARNDSALYLTGEREAEGLIPVISIQKSLTTSILPRMSRWGVSQTKKEKRLAGDLIRTLDTKAFPREQNIGQFSGEDKQKVLVGKVAAYTPQVYLLNEPTRGVDIRAKESTLSTIHCEFRKQSCVIITSPGVEDPIKICNRTLILYEGKVIDWFSREEFSEKQIHRTMRGEVIHIDEVKKS